MTGSRKGDAWYEGYLEQILAPGYLRVCLQCREAEKKLQCEVCGENLPSEAFSKSVLKNDKGTGRYILCKECNLKVPQVLHKCDCCLDQLPRTAFEDSAWANKSYATRRTLCKECKHPQCTVENCKTCRSCRSTKCKNKNCRKPFAFNIHQRNQPKDKAARERFRCENCCFPACSDCGAKMPEGGCRARFLQSGASTWTCSECQNFPLFTCCQSSIPKKLLQAFLRANITIYSFLFYSSPFPRYRTCSLFPSSS